MWSKVPFFQTFRLISNKLLLQNQLKNRIRYVRLKKTIKRLVQSFYMSGKSSYFNEEINTFWPNSIVNFPNIIKLLSFSFWGFFVATCIIINQTTKTRTHRIHTLLLFRDIFTRANDTHTQ